MTPSFSPAKIKHMFTLMKSCVESMEKAVKKEIRSKSSAELDTRSLYGKFSLDVIAKCAFATDARCHESTDNSTSAEKCKEMSGQWCLNRRQVIQLSEPGESKQQLSQKKKKKKKRKE